MKIFKNLNIWFRGGPESIPKHECPPIDWFSSKIADGGGTPPHPFLCYGHAAVEFARTLSERTSANAIAPRDLAGLHHVLHCSAFSAVGLQFPALIAMSRPDQSGEAGEAIRIFRAENRIRGMAPYGAWDYNVQRAAGRAIEYAADGVLMPGIVPNEMFAYSFGLLARVQSGAEPPRTVLEHEALLREFTSPASPFWNNQDALASSHF